MKTRNNIKIFSGYTIFPVAFVVLFISFGFSSKSNLNNKKTDSEITKEFKGIKTIDISTVSGNCKIMRGEDSTVKITLTHHYKPARTYEPIFEQKGDLLKLKEKMKGSNSGYSEWVLTVPEQMDITFKSASGSMSIKDITGKINVRTASGRVEASNIKITESSKFSSASGNVNVTFSDSPMYDVSASSASGDAIIDFNNNPIAGTIEMQMRKDIGNMDCPIGFTSEKEVIDDSNQTYIVRRVVVSNESPIIKICTASGTARLKK